MRYLDDATLRRISDHILRASVRGLRIHCLLELLRCGAGAPGEEEALDARVACALRHGGSGAQGSSCGSWGSLGSCGPAALAPGAQPVPAFPDVAMRERQNRRTYVYLAQALQGLFPHADVPRALPPSCFFEVQYDGALHAINAALTASLQNYASVQRYLMLAIFDACPAEQTRVYTADFAQQPNNFFEGDDGVWSQNFLFYNIQRGKILIFTLKAVPEPDGLDDEFADEYFDDDRGGDGDSDERIPLDGSNFDAVFPDGSKFFNLF